MTALTSGDGRIRVAIAAARFNADIVDRLVDTAVAELGILGVDDDRVTVLRVPGAFELPIAALALLRGPEPPDGVICLGAVVKGETPHFDFVAGAAADGILRVGLETGRPVIFGVLTTNTLEQAWDRADGRYQRGVDAARAAVEMIHLLRAIAAGPATGHPPPRAVPLSGRARRRR